MRADTAELFSLVSPNLSSAAETRKLSGCRDSRQGPDQLPESLDCPGSPVMSMSRSDPAKMRAVRASVVAVMVTSAGADGAPAVSDHWWPSLSTR